MEEEEGGVGSKGEIQENAKVGGDNNTHATQALLLAARRKRSVVRK
jgi:hypothetical protein